MVKKLYYAGLNPGIRNLDVYRRKITEAYGDYIIGCPTMDFAKSVFGRGNASVKVYQVCALLYHGI